MVIPTIIWYHLYILETNSVSACQVVSSTGGEETEGLYAG